MFQRAKSCCAKKVLPWMKYLGGIMRGQMPYLGEDEVHRLSFFLTTCMQKKNIFGCRYISLDNRYLIIKKHIDLNAISAVLTSFSLQNDQYLFGNLNWILKSIKNLCSIISKVTWIFNRIISLIAVPEDSLYLIEKKRYEWGG